MVKAIEQLSDPEVREAVYLLRSKGLTYTDFKYAARWLDAYEDIFPNNENECTNE